MVVQYQLKMALSTQIRLIVFFKAILHKFLVELYLFGKIRFIQNLPTVFSKKMWQTMVAQYQL